MSEQTPEVGLVDLQPQTVLLMRGSLPMAELPQFFDRAFPAVAQAMGEQGVPFIGPPVGVYFGVPAESVQVGAGFPIPGPMSASGELAVETLPGGRAAQVTHVGSYDSMMGTYDVLMTWMREQGLESAEVMWETYLTEPTPDGDPSAMRTLITWPVQG